MTTLASLVAHASYLFDRKLFAHAKHLGLPPTEGRVLLALAKSEGVPMWQLAQHAAVKQSTLSRAVDRLECARLVERLTPDGDRRRCLVLLTERGARMAIRLLSRARERELAMPLFLGEEELQKLTMALSRLNHVLDDIARQEAQRSAAAASFSRSARDRRQRRARQERRHAQRSLDTPAAAQYLKDPPTVLFVEDDTEVRTVVAQLLASSGFRTLVAPTGDEALSLLAEHRIDALFTDIVMPGLTGIELATQARSRYPDLKVLFMTGYYSRGSEAAKLGPLLYKPVRSTEIEAELRKLLAAA